MEEEYYPKLDWDDEADLETKVKALYNTHNWLTREMSIGRVPNNKKEIENNLNLTKQKLEIPLSIAFVKMVEKGEIDEITASENADMFIEWDDKSSFKAGTIRKRNNLLYLCLQDHAGQTGWEPENTPALWKQFGINENGISDWSQPISIADAYMLNSETMHNGYIWVSDYDNNVWEPGVFGWHIKGEEENTEETPEIPEVPQNPSGDTL